MTKPKKARLGRGLDALLGDSAVIAAMGGAADEQTVARGNASDVFKNLPVECLQRGKYQPRNLMDETALAELTVSILAQGVMQPILVRALADGHYEQRQYEIVAGERRWRAAQMAGLTQVPVIIRQIADETAMATALIENIQREDLSALEEARGLKRLIKEFGVTHQQAADSIGRSRAAVTNALRLLSLSPAVQDLLEQKQFEMGHARALLAVPENEQLAVATIIIKQKMTVRQVELWVKKYLEKEPPPKTPTISADIMKLQEELSDALGATVSLQDKQGRGKLVIDYHSLPQLDGIIEKLRT